ncbi:hypothetical protein HDU81_007711 [Chytriomyces hyalinus]|nr:hypothetical protein HDU81_007711 [Chytriomyces hyalinus]
MFRNRIPNTASDQTTHQLNTGIDASTQSLTALLCRVEGDTTKLTRVWQHSIPLDTLNMGTHNGVIHGPDGSATTPSLVFIAALDRVLALLKKECPDALERIVAVSGCGQQHGSVYWGVGAASLIAEMNPEVEMKEQLKGAFAILDGPIWMDSSSTKWCQRLERDLGGPQAVANLTGSRAYERFTINQVAKLIDTHPEEFKNVSRISLVSSLLTSVFAGRFVGIDESDATGMNALDLKTKTWSVDVLKSVGGEVVKNPESTLANLLGPVATPYLPVDNISAYFVERYGFSPKCKVVPFTGDNPSTLAGLGISAAGDLAVSLGTSDTAFAVVAKSACKPSGVEGHILLNPVDPDTFIAMLCFKNGSLARQQIRDKYANGQWTDFNSMLSQTKPGNNGFFGFFHPEQEITPPTSKPNQIHMFDATSDTPIPNASSVAPEIQIRAIVEQHALRLKHHTQVLGVSEVKRILVSGGASANFEILRVLSNVFGVPVFETVGGSTAAAAYGGILRAQHAMACEAEGGMYVPFKPEIEVRLVVEPDDGAYKVYQAGLERFEKLERVVVGL